VSRTDGSSAAMLKVAFRPALQDQKKSIAGFGPPCPERIKAADCPAGKEEPQVGGVSTDRGRSAKSSDVDLIVEFDGPVGFRFIDLSEYLENLLVPSESHPPLIFRERNWPYSYKTSCLGPDGRPVSILRDFCIPVLKRSRCYDRVAGYFRATSLAVAPRVLRPSLQLMAG